jgi:hypothetical protein
MSLVCLAVPDPSFWVKLLFTYGPFALIVFVAFVLERLARAHKKESPSPSATAIYVATWTLMFVMAGVITWVWYKTNVAPSEFAIRGRLAGLKGDEQLRTRFHLLFLRREYENPPNFEVSALPKEFRTLEAHELEDILCIFKNELKNTASVVPRARGIIKRSWYD